MRDAYFLELGHRKSLKYNLILTESLQLFLKMPPRDEPSGRERQLQDKVSNQQEELQRLRTEQRLQDAIILRQARENQQLRQQLLEGNWTVNCHLA